MEQHLFEWKKYGKSSFLMEKRWKHHYFQWKNYRKFIIENYGKLIIVNRKTMENHHL
jgi:hypothetical protein